MLSSLTRTGKTLALVLVVLTASAGAALGQPGDDWVGTWAAGLQAQEPADPTAASQSDSAAPQLFAPLPRIAGQTLRQFVIPSLGGSRIRIGLTNAFGTGPVRIGAGSVALRSQGSQIVASTAAALTFGGEPSVTIEAGSVVTSDPVVLDVPLRVPLAIDLYFPDDLSAHGSPITGLRGAWTTNFLSTTGDHTRAEALPVESTLTSWLFLARVEVLAPRHTPVIVTLGDSITEGFGSTLDTNRRWPDVLATRLVDEHGDAAPAVLNVGISGNRVLQGNDGRFGVIPSTTTGSPNPNAGFGPSALARFDRDVLLQPGVTHVIVLESINDIGMTSDPSTPTVEELIAGHRALIQRAHASGVTIYAGTLTPFEGALYFTEEGEMKRQAVNDWIRTSGAYDGVIDFDAVVRDTRRPRRFLPMYHPGDWLHPNDEGYRAMGEAIDLTLFTSVPEERVPLAR